ncbi:hypothetical protein OY671_009806, partial [Metschnikowia pulcherrima]
GRFCTGKSDAPVLPSATQLFRDGSWVSLMGVVMAGMSRSVPTAMRLRASPRAGVTAETSTTTQVNASEGKNCNVFVNYDNDTAIIEQGVMANGYLFDEVHGTDWFQNYSQTASYNRSYTSTTKIPQTDAGVNDSSTAAAAAADQTVANGLVAPGVWNADGFGNSSRGDTLSSGYYSYAP